MKENMKRLFTIMPLLFAGASNAYAGIDCSYTIETSEGGHYRFTDIAALSPNDCHAAAAKELLSYSERLYSGWVKVTAVSGGAHSGFPIFELRMDAKNND